MRQKNPKESAAQVPSRHVDIAWWALGFCLLLSCGIWLFVQRATTERIAERFDHQCDEVTRRVKVRVGAYEHMLLGTRGMVEALPSPTRAQWHRFVDTLSLASSFPGALAVGYSIQIPKAHVAEVESRFRNAEAPLFAIWPTHQRDEIHAVIAIEPMNELNSPMLGFDMMTEPTRRAAMKRARETGQPVISGGIRVSRAEGSPKSFAMFVPVYKTEAPPADPVARVAALQGIVFCIFGMDALLSDIGKDVQAQLAFEVFDMPEALPKHLLYSSGEIHPGKDTLTLTKHVEMQGRTWYLRFHQGPDFTLALEKHSGPLLGLILGLLNGLLFVSIRSLSRQRTRAQQLALAMTDDIRIQMAKNQELLDRFEKIAAHAPGILFQYKRPMGAPPVFPYASQAMQTYFQITPETAASDASPIQGLIHPEDLPSFNKSLAHSESQISQWKHQFRVTMADGETHWLYGTATPEQEADGSVLWHGFITDITELRMAESKAQEALAELSFQKFAMDQHAIVECTDTDGRITYVNDRFCALSGFSREMLIGQTHRLVGSGHHPREFFREMFHVISLGKVWHGEICNRNRTGGVFWLETTIVPILRDGIKVERYFAIRTDITHRKLLENSLCHARDQAYESSRLKSEFLAGMSHEIRTPMNGIIGMGNLLLTTPLSAQQLEMTRVLHSSAEALLRIIDDVLDFSKIEAGKLHIDSSLFNLGTLIDDIVRLLAPRAQDKQLALTSQCDTRCKASFLGDPGRIRQILLNLTGNALKFTEKGHITIEVAVLEDKSDASVFLFTITDTGIGITTEAQRHLFQPFVQADGTTTRRFGGTGLGLAISKQLAELMGGSIGYTSTPGKGSSFWIELELAKPPSTVLQNGDTRRGESNESTQAPLPPESPSFKAAGESTLHFLLAEDNPANQLVARYMLTDMGHTFDLAENGRQAINKLRSGRYDAVLMDCQMPELDGYEATRLIRSGLAGSENSRIPILALTAYAMKGDKEKCMEAGMSGYVTKPINKKALCEALERCGIERMPSPPRPASEQKEDDARPKAIFDEGQWNTLANLSAGNGNSALDEVAALFAKHSQGRLAELGKHIETGDLAQVARAAHTLAGSAASLGASLLHAAALNLERGAKSSSKSELSQLHAAVERASADVLEELRRRNRLKT